jgi:hypothetical protein
MTFAELVIKFETQGNDKVLRDVRSIEVELKKVSSSSVNSANKISSSMTRIGQSSRVFENIKSVGMNISQQFANASASSIPFGDNLLDIVQTLSIMGNKVNIVQKFFEILGTVGKRVLDGLVLLPTTIGKAFIMMTANVAKSIMTFLMETTVLKKLEGVILKALLGFARFSNVIVGATVKIADFGFAVRQAIIETFSPVLQIISITISKFAGLLTVLGEVGSAFIGLSAAMAIVGGAVIAMDLAIAKPTIEAAFAFEQLQQRLEALTTPEKATDILAFVRKLAEPSNFTTQQLAEASVQLEAFGLNSKRILPIMAQLGMAFGADAEKLRLLTDMFGRLGQGQLPDQQVMAQFGISKSKLMKEGIKFDNQGSLVSSTKEVMVAIEKIVTRDYGKIFDKMANTGNAKLASLTDVFERLKIGIGIQLAETAKGAISSFTNVLTAIEKSGILEQAARTMILPFEALAKAFGGEGKSGIFDNAQIQIASFVGAFVAGFEELNIQTALFIERMSLIGKLVADFATMNPQTAVKNFRNLAKNLTGTNAPTRMFDRGQEITYKILDQMQQQGSPSNIKDLFDTSKLGDFGKLEDLLKGDKSGKDKQTRTLEKIQQNTKTQNEITLRNLTYGGGELAAQGLSAVQMSGFRSVSSPGINAGNDIVRGVEKIVRGYSNSNNLNFSFKRS